MKTSIFRFVTLSAICASFLGMAALAPAYGPGDRIRAQIAQLQVRKDRAIAHHNRGKARDLQAEIDVLRAKLHHHHW